MIIWMCFWGLWQHIRHVAENTACLISRQPGSKKKGWGGEKKGAVTFKDMSSDLNSFP